MRTLLALSACLLFAVPASGQVAGESAGSPDPSAVLSGPWQVSVGLAVVPGGGIVYRGGGPRLGVGVELETPSVLGVSLVAGIEGRPPSDYPHPPGHPAEGESETPFNLRLLPRFRVPVGADGWRAYVDVIPFAVAWSRGRAEARGNLGSPSDWRWGAGVEAPINSRSRLRIGVDYNPLMPRHDGAERGSWNPACGSAGCSRRWGAAVAVVVPL